MSTDPEPDYEIFEDYLELPKELRMMIIDRMEPDDRCRFTRCSKLCSREAKASKNYIYALKLKDNFTEAIEIEVSFSEKSCYKNKSFGYGYHLLFCKSEGKKFIECRRIVPGHPMGFTSGLKELWKIDLDDSANRAQLATEHFTKLLEVHQNTIKCLVIGGKMEMNIFEHKNIDFGIERLNSLEELVMTTDADISQFAPKVRKTLNGLVVRNERNVTIIEDWDKIYTVREYLYLPFLKLNNEQFLRLTAPFIEMHIGELTEEDIFNFIRSWQNGTNGKEKKRYHWNLNESNFDVAKLLILLEAPGFDLGNEELDIYHNIDSRCVAVLEHSFIDSPLMFETYFEEGSEDDDKDEEEEEEEESESESEEEMEEDNEEDQ